MTRRATIAVGLGLGLAFGIGSAGSPSAVLAESADTGYTIDRYDVSIELRDNATMTVSEDIAVTFNEPRHGIYRVIPIDYPTDKGVNRRVQIDLKQVVDETGSRYTTDTTSEGANLRIRIGDADVMLLPGTKKTYRLVYDAVGMINWFDATSDWEPAAELYWNVTGTDWTSTIQNASAHVSFPAAEDPSHVRLRVYAGPYGSRAYDEAVGPASDVLGDATGARMSVTTSAVDATLDRPLAPFEGLTIVLEVPAGSIHHLGAWQQARLFILPNLGFTLPIWATLILLTAWWVKGRDPDGGPMVVQYEPPDGITGAEAGALVDERVDQRDLAAGVIELAVNGYIEIFPKEEGLIFKKRVADVKLTGKARDAGMPKFQGELLTKLESVGNDTITNDDLREKVAPSAGSLRSALYLSLADHGYYPGSPDTTKIVWLVIGLVMVIALAGVFVLISPTKSALPAVVGAAIALLPVGIVSRAMPRRTPAGARAHQQVLGFEEFIRRAQTDRLEWQSKVEPTAALFEKYLPHAVAFGLVTQWTTAFAAVLAAAPTWYHTTYGGPFMPNAFASDLSTVADSVGSAASTPPRSSGASGGNSGFGGGGFSGGGFGGGGGGSW